MKPYYRIWFAFLVGLCLVLQPMLTYAEALQSSGAILSAIGKVSAVNSKEIIRALQRGDSFYAEDTIKTEGNSHVTLRFSDGTLVELKENSNYKVSAYHFKSDQPDKDSFAAELIEGGFRTITGLLGKRNPDNYEVKARMTTLTIRGTEYTAGFTSEGNLETFLESGVIVVQVTDGSSLTLDHSHPGASVGINKQIQPLKTMPAVLQAGFRPGGFRALRQEGAATAPQSTQGTVFIQGDGAFAPPNGPSGSANCNQSSSM